MYDHIEFEILLSTSCRRIMMCCKHSVTCEFLASDRQDSVVLWPWFRFSADACCSKPVVQASQGFDRRGHYHTAGVPATSMEED